MGGSAAVAPALRILSAVENQDTVVPASVLEDGSSDYLSGHFRALRAGLGYDRRSYGLKAWRTFEESVPFDRSSRILEIGPGECELIELLRDDLGFENVSVIDMSPEVIGVAHELGIPATLVDDAQTFLMEEEARYEAIFLLHVLEHIRKDEIIPLLRAARYALTSGGRLLVEVPNMGDPLNGLYFRYSDFTHEVGFTEESLRYVLTQAGFSSVNFLDQVGAAGRITRPLQTLARKTLHALLFVVNLPNGRQMRRRIGPVLSVRSDV